MKWLTVLFLAGAWACWTSFLYARAGKVFFSGDRWLKGDIQTQTDESGREMLVIAMKSGSVIVPKSEVKTIIFANGTRLTDHRDFYRALENTPSSRSVQVSEVPTLYEPYIRVASRKHRMDPELIKAVIKQESNFNRKDVSNKGAQGLMQLMPDTARGLGVQDAFDPWENIHGGTRYLRLMLENFNGDLSMALAAYNAGPYAVEKYGAIPPYKETRNYVRNVLRYYEFYRGSKLYSFKDKNGSLVITDQPFLP